jgi:hypothetical protein
MKGDFLGHAPEMYTALRNIAEVVVALNGDGIEIPLSLYVEVKRAEHLLAEIDKEKNNDLGACGRWGCTYRESAKAD